MWYFKGNIYTIFDAFTYIIAENSAVFMTHL